jgi:hypothetical protein
MPRPKGMDTGSRADLFYLWAIVAAFAICALVGLNMAFASFVGAQTVNRAVKVDAGCTAIDVLARDVSKRFPGQETRRLEGNEAAAFMAAYNALPPVSNFVATQLLIVFHERHKATRIAFFSNGCAVALATVPIDVVRALLSKTQGASI